MGCFRSVSGYVVGSDDGMRCRFDIRTCDAFLKTLKVLHEARTHISHNDSYIGPLYS